MTAWWRGPVLVLVALLAASAMVLATPRPASACRCTASQPHEQYARADAVFVGRVSRVEHFDADASPYVPGRERWQYATLDVSESWKGVDASPVAVVVGASAASAATCGFDLANHQQYLVLGTRHPEGTIVTHVCSGTTPRVPEARTMFGLGAGAPVPSGATLPGRPLSGLGLFGVTGQAFGYLLVAMVLALLALGGVGLGVSRIARLPRSR